MLSTKYEIGQFDKRIQILHKVITLNDFNEEIETWALLKTRWAKEEPSSGNESIEADKLTATRRTVFVVRYDSDVDVEMRVVFDDVVFDIVSVKQPDGNRKRFLALDCMMLEGEVSPVEVLGEFSEDFSDDFNT